MPRGRPPKSEIRQHIVEIISVLGQAYGYQVFQVYQRIYPKATLRSIYYHLTKGASFGEFQVERVSMEKGDYSWGGEAEKVYYKLGPKAHPSGDERVHRAVEELKLQKSAD